MISTHVTTEGVFTGTAIVMDTTPVETVLMNLQSVVSVYVAYIACLMYVNATFENSGNFTVEKTQFGFRHIRIL